MVMANTEYIRPSRLERLADILQDHPYLDLESLNETFAPGTFGCHEALHATSMVTVTINDQLLGHAAIAANPEWFKLAQSAFDSLIALYHAIGSEHFPAMQAAESRAEPRLSA